MKYQVVEHMFPALKSVIAVNLTFKEAEELCEKYSDCDAYTDFVIEEMKQTIKEKRKEKLEKISSL
jgi:hypothetical protein